MNVNLELAASRGVTRVLPETLKRILFNPGSKTFTFSKYKYERRKDGILRLATYDNLSLIVVYSQS